MAADKTLEQLNSFLRGELAAVETYRQALEQVSDPGLRETLEDCERSHEHRIRVLREHIERLGGMPAADAGPWGTFSKMVERSAVLDDTAAIEALEDGEDHGLADYSSHDELDRDSERLVSEELLPEQQRTHAALSRLKHRRN